LERQTGYDKPYVKAISKNEQQRTLSEDHPEWEMALAYREENHPQYLAELLRKCGLEKSITQKMEMYERALVQSGGNVELATEAVLSVNSNWQDQESLTEEDEKLLKQFKDGNY
jgi:hypothetical protein